MGLYGTSDGGPGGPPVDPNAGGPAGGNVMMPNPNAPQNAIGGPATAPSYMPPTPNTQTTGLQPGQGSSGDVGYNVNAPGAGEDVAGSYLNYYGATGTPTTSNNSQQAYTDFRGSSPTDMSPYYDNAQRNSANDINKQMAARGQYGSSNAVGVLSNASTNLRAQQAKDEAQYGLSRYGLEGQLASGSDQASGQQSANELNWMKGLTDTGFQTEKEAAARAQLGLDWTKGAADTASGIIGSTYGNELNNDQSLLGNVTGATGGAASDAVTAAQNKQQASQAQDARTVAAATSALSYFV